MYVCMCVGVCMCVWKIKAEKNKVLLKYKGTNSPLQAQVATFRMEPAERESSTVRTLRDRKQDFERTVDGSNRTRESISSG